jgi:WD40 repeat protein
MLHPEPSRRVLTVRPRMGGSLGASATVRSQISPRVRGQDRPGALRVLTVQAGLSNVTSAELCPREGTLMKRYAGIVAALTFALVPVLVAQPANATYPGRNGLIAIAGDRGDGSEIYSVLPDGTQLTRLTNVAGAAFDPDWSPDGTKIVFDVTLQARSSPPAST